MNPAAAETLKSVASNGYMTAEDVLALRRVVFADGVVSTAELDALFALGERAPEGDKEWEQFFAEAAADFYLREEEPRGHLTEEEFRSLKARVTRDGERASGLELALLVKLMEDAVTTPPDMAEFVGRELKRMIAERKGGPRISAKDVALIRRWLFAAGGDGNVAVTRREAELLFDLNDVVAGAKNDAAWADLFCKAVANHLMAHIGYKPVGRAEALRLHAFMSNRSTNVGGVLSRALSGGLGGVARRFADGLKREESLAAARNAAREAEAAEAAKVTQSEADWVAERIGRDGALGEGEKALVRHLKSLADELPPRLKDVVARAA